MGALVSTGVHYREGGVCKAALVLNDNPPDYDTLDITTVVLNLGVTVFGGHAGVGLDPASPPTTNGKWHYASAPDCPDS